MKNLIFLLIVVSIIYSQSGNSIVVYPKQNSIGASLDSKVTVELENSGWVFDSTCILHCYGSHHYYLPGNSEIINGSKFVFTPIVEFSPGEEIWVSFGPILNTESGKYKTITWNFIIDVPRTKSIKFGEPTYNSDLVFEAGAGLVDVDLDGDLDLMSVYGRLALNDGWGNFYTAPLPELFETATYVYDINNDGLRDKIVVAENSIYIYLQDSLGSMVHTQTIPIRGSLLGDFNNDNFVDLLTIGYGENTKNIFPIFNNKDGTFTPQNEIIVTESELASIEAIDVNNDFSLDIFTSYRDVYPYINNYKIWLKDSDTSYNKIEFVPWIMEEPQTSRMHLEPYKLIDMDKNGLVDIVNFSPEEGGAIYYQNEPNIFTCSEAHFFGNSETEGVVAYGDLDGDDDLDITQGLEITAPEMGYNSPVYANWFVYGDDYKYGNRNLFPELGILSDMGDWSGGTFGDIDGDGDLDYVFPRYKLVILESVDVVGIEKEKQEISSVNLTNYPNPFNPNTRINYNLKNESYVLLEILNVTGERVKMLADDIQNAGEHSVIFDGSNHASGVYFCKLQVKNKEGKTIYSQGNKMVLLK